MQMGMTLSLRMEQHDDECRRCGEPKSSDRDCASCSLENARLGATGEGSIALAIDDMERERNARRKENGHG